jgi:hypothetical protein
VKLAFRLDLSSPRKFRTLFDEDVGDPAEERNDWNSEHAYLNAGFTEKFYTAVDDPPRPRLKKIILKNGDEPREEMLLKWDGSFDEEQQDPEDASYIIPSAYKPADYSVLPAVS